MKPSILGLLFLALVPICKSATWIDKSGTPVADNDAMKSSKNFIAHLVLTTQPDSLAKTWRVPAETVKVNTSSEVEIGKPISSFIIFGGCKVDRKGNCNLVATFKFFQPNGKVCGEVPETEVWVNKPVPPNHNVELGLASIDFVADSDEPVGKYKVEAVVTDKNDGRSVNLSAEFLIKKMNRK